MGEVPVRLWSPELLPSAMVNLDNPLEWYPLKPLRPVPLMHKHSQRCKVIHEMHPIGHKK